MATIGNTGIGASFIAFEDGHANGSVQGIPITMTEDGTSDSIWVYVQEESTNNDHGMVVSIYDNSNNLLDSSSLDASATTTAGWHEIALSGVGLSDGNTYKLALQVTGGAGNLRIYYDTDPGAGFNADPSYPTIPDPLSPTTQDRAHSMYLEYTPGGGGTSKNASDTAAIATSDSASVLDIVGKSASDTAAVAASESANVDTFDAKAASDTASVAVSESADVNTSIVEKAASDTATISLNETPFSTIYLESPDTFVIAISESADAQGSEVGKPVSETLSIALSEIASIARTTYVQSSDTGVIAISESASAGEPPTSQGVAKFDGDSFAAHL